MGVIVGVDGGHSKTALVAARTDGEVLASLRGPGSNLDAVGVEGAAEVIGALVAGARLQLPADVGVFSLCGADLPEEVAALEEALRRRAWVRELHVENDTLALLRAGTDAVDAVAVVCGSGINCVGRSGARSVRYPALGPLTGDWGGGDMLAREALFLAVRSEDGRGAPTGLVDAVRAHFGTATAEEAGIALHARRIPAARLVELAPRVVDAAGAGDAVAGALLDRLAGEIGLLVEKALRDLGLELADVVLGGGLLQAGAGPLHDRVAARLPAGARPVVVAAPPVLGAVLAALDAAGADEAAKERVRGAL